MSSARREIEDEIDPTIVTDPNAKTVTLYGIKTCSTVKAARKGLEEGGYAVMWRDVKAKDMGLSDFEYLEGKVGWDRLVNKSSRTWRELDAAQKDGLTRESALDLLVQKPTLMKRPAIDCGDKVLLGWTDDVRAQMGC